MSKVVAGDILFSPDPGEVPNGNNSGRTKADQPYFLWRTIVVEVVNVTRVWNDEQFEVVLAVVRDEREEWRFDPITPGDPGTCGVHQRILHSKGFTRHESGNFRNLGRGWEFAGYRVFCLDNGGHDIEEDEVLDPIEENPNGWVTAIMLRIEEIFAYDERDRESDYRYEMGAEAFARGGIDEYNYAMGYGVVEDYDEY